MNVRLRERVRALLDSSPPPFKLSRSQGQIIDEKCENLEKFVHFFSAIIEPVQELAIGNMQCYKITINREF